MIARRSIRRARAAAAPMLLAAAVLVVTSVVVSAQSPTVGPSGSAGPRDPGRSAAPVRPASGRVMLYTSVTQDTVDAVLGALESVHPELEVEVFRAPTGELDARIATELRTGGVAADVLWATDPLSVQRYAADGLLRPLHAAAFAVVPSAYRTETFAGTRLLNLVIVTRTGLETRPSSWSSLADPSLAGRVAIPDPGFAGSAFAALGTFAADPSLGMAFYRRLKDNGAVQLPAIGDVVTGVAEGRYDAGIALDKVVADAIAQGSPIEMVWPEPGAIAIFSPVATFASTDDPIAADAFAAFLVSSEAQEAIASTGWQPIRADVAWSAGGPVITPDWAAMFGRQQELLEEYRQIFGE